MKPAALELATLCFVAGFTTSLSLHVPGIRTHARAALACAALYIVRLVGGPRAAVAAFVLWPGVAAWLAFTALKDERPDVVAEPRRPMSLCMHNSRWATRTSTVTLAALVVYAFALACWGYYLTPWWPWPLLLPNAAPALVLWLGRRPRTWPERAAHILPASAFADLVTTWAGAPNAVRAVIGCVTWFVFGGMIVACAIEPRAPSRR